MISVCEYSGKWYEAGDGFPDDDGCNTCNCQRGSAVACTLMLCLGTPIPENVK
ncbi:hypothetical protein DPMN_010488 [Dreissena polymorpha]|uniref:Pacifastin domain-containing protein n=1 Tax=Dreissena polymorpha TaxID=45954 RepID=A0A9D4N254_DREPO|nr:hypothetical protein DPMN_010488 [Dreissena polymorpha]